MYSLGVMLYEMIAGWLPFGGDTNAAIMRQHLIKDLPLLAAQRAELPVVLTELVHRMLAKEPADRPTMPEVFLAMDDLLPTTERNLRGLRQELALHRTTSPQHIIGPDDAYTDPLAPTLGGPPQAETVTPLGLVRSTPISPITEVKTRRLPLLLIALLALALARGLGTRLPLRSASRRAAEPVATHALSIPASAGASAETAAAPVLVTPPPSAVAEPAAPPADRAPARPADKQKVSKPRPRRPKSAAHNAPRLEDEPEQPWR